MKAAAATCLSLLLLLMKGASQVSSTGCTTMQIFQTRNFAHLHGDYQKQVSTCSGKPVYSKNNQYFLYYHQQEWLFSDRVCTDVSGSFIASQHPNTSQPAMVYYWKERDGRNLTLNHNIRVRCKPLSGCVPNPCINGGSCHGEGICTCLPEHTGTYCETLITTTKKMPSTPTPKMPSTPTKTTPKPGSDAGSCYKCDAAGNTCGTNVSSAGVVSCNFQAGNACWQQRTTLNSIVSYQRFCDAGCTANHKAGYYCDESRGNEVCRKCCTSALCNNEVATLVATTPSPSAGACKLTVGELHRLVYIFAAILSYMWFLI